MKELRKRLMGHVVSNKMDKTVVVKVERRQRHRLYGKVVKKSRKFKAHDAYNSCQVGDMVRIVESRPLSKEKRWVVEEIVEKANKTIV
jgi:small subunit ribosomal protein S17